MPFNGSGLFTRNYNWVNDKQAAIPITASRVDADSNDFANGLSSVVTRDGQGPAQTKNIVNGVGATSYTGSFDNNSSYLILNKNGSGHVDSVSGLNNGNARWALILGDSTAESGADSGSNLALNRYHDAGTLIDSPISINRATGVTTITNLVAGALSAPPSTPTSLALTGSLSVGTTATFTGVATFNAGNQGAQVSVVAGQFAQYRCIVAGQRNWAIGEAPSGYFRIADDTAAAERMTINSSGAVSIAQGLNVGGALIGHAITGTTASFSSTLGVTGAVTLSSTLTVQGTLQVNGATAGISGTNAQLFLTSNSVRAWYIGALNNGLLYFVDNSSGLTTATITGGSGQWTFYYPTICNSNLTVSGALTVSGTSTLVGTISCNAISCANINTNGNDITCNHPIVQDGVNYANLGGHTIGFNNSGTTLTFSALGGSSGSWTFNPSDERFKENIGPTTGDALAELQSLGLISFDLPLPDEPTRHFNYGFSAQNVASVLADDSVTTTTLSDGREQLVLDSLSITARCVGAIQQLAARVEALEAQLASR